MSNNFTKPTDSSQAKKHDFFDPTLSIFPSATNTDPLSHYPLSKIIDAIQSNPSWRSLIENLRKINRQICESSLEPQRAKLKDSYNEEKKKLQAITPSGEFSYRNNNSLVNHSLIIGLDYDFETETEAIAFKEKVSKIPEVITAFISPGGDGVKVWVRIATATDISTHHSAFDATTAYISSLCGEDATADDRANALSVLCFISHDPDIYYNPRATPFDWERYLDEHPDLRQDETPNNEPLEPSAFQYDGEEAPQWLSDALSYIPADEYYDWLSVGSALKHGGFPFEVFDEWSQTSDKYNASDAWYKWEKGFDRIPFDYIITTAQRNGWQAPADVKSKFRKKQRAKAILFPKPIPAPSQTWQDQQPALEAAFSADTDTVLIKADTGTGKGHVSHSHILKSNPSAYKFVEMNSRTDIINERFHDFQARQRDAHEQKPYVWRSIFHGWNQHGEKPFHERRVLVQEGELNCVQAPTFDALRRKGAEPRAVLCRACPVYDACSSKGYRSQVKSAQGADYLLSAQDGLFFDKSLSGFAKEIIKSNGRIVTGIVDEIRAHELYSECVLTKAELQQMWEVWKDTPAGVFADGLIDALEKGMSPGYEKVRAVVTSLSENQRRLIISAFTKIRIQGKARVEEEDKIFDEEILLAGGKFDADNGKEIAIAVSDEALEKLKQRGIPAVFRHEIDSNVLMISYEQAIDFGFYEIQNDNDETGYIADFPKLHPNRHWTPLHQLEKLFSEYPRIEDTPIHYNGESLRFYLPPLVHPSIDKIIMMSATADSEVISKKIFTDRDVEVADAEPVKWVEGNQVFQVRTGKYPRASVLDTEGNLKGFGQKAWEAMCDEIKRTPDKQHAVITYKCLSDAEGLGLPSNVVFAHYGAAEGENEKWKDCDVFWILFDPRLPPHEVERRAKLIYGKDTEPLNYAYDKEKGCYADPRLQQIADSYASSELIQAIGRARLLRREGIKVVIMTGRELEGISGRAETTLFDLEDFTTALGLDTLKETVRKREQEAAEMWQRVTERIEAGTSDNKICKEFSIHHTALTKFKVEYLPALGNPGMSDGSQHTIRTLIAACEDQTFRNELPPPYLPESPQTRPTTTFEPDSEKLAALEKNLAAETRSPPENLAAAPAARKIGRELHCDMILEFVAGGEKKRSEIIASLGVNEGSVDRALRYLAGKGLIVRVVGKPGYYAPSELMVEAPTTLDLRRLPPAVWDIKQNHEARALLSELFGHFLKSGEGGFLSDYQLLVFAFWWLHLGKSNVEDPIADIHRVFVNAQRLNPELKHPLRPVYHHWLVSRSPPQ